jgi:hypothetical protein
VLSSRSFGNINFLWRSVGDIKKLLGSDGLSISEFIDSFGSEAFLLLS